MILLALLASIRCHWPIKFNQRENSFEFLIYLFFSGIAQFIKDSKDSSVEFAILLFDDFLQGLDLNFMDQKFHIHTICWKNDFGIWVLHFLYKPFLLRIYSPKKVYLSFFKRRRYLSRLDSLKTEAWANLSIISPKVYPSVSLKVLALENNCESLNIAWTTTAACWLIRLATTSRTAYKTNYSHAFLFKLLLF